MKIDANKKVIPRRNRFSFSNTISYSLKKSISMNSGIFDNLDVFNNNFFIKGDSVDCSILVYTITQTPWMISLSGKGKDFNFKETGIEYDKDRLCNIHLLSTFPISFRFKSNIAIQSMKILSKNYYKGEVKQMNYRQRMMVNNFLGDGFGIYNPMAMVEQSLIQSASRAIKVRYGEELFLEENEARTANKWIKHHDNKFENRKKNNNGILADTQFVFMLEPYTFCYIQVGSNIERWNRGYNRENVNHLGMIVYIWGKHYKKYIKELKDIIKMKDDKNLYIYSVKGFSDESNEQGVNSIGRIMDKRSTDTLFFNNHIKEQVFEHIDNFLVNKQLYEEKGLSYKTGILLYGAPGTGKTSFATALATKYNYNLIVVDMGTFDKLDINTLTICINADDEKYIVLLEDIDTLFTSLDRKDDLDKEERKIVNKMLQFLDSSSSPSDVIFIATTNHVEKLDDAITRDGRFDLKVEIGNIKEDVAKEMVKSFSVDDKEIDEIVSACKDEKTGLINPAKLQNKIISRFKGLRLNVDTDIEDKEDLDDMIA